MGFVEFYESFYSLPVPFLPGLQNGAEVGALHPAELFLCVVRNSRYYIYAAITARAHMGNGFQAISSLISLTRIINGRKSQFTPPGVSI